jgi:hypothetical protein
MSEYEQDGVREGSEGQTEEWAEVLARTVAHLAAQLTVSQLRLRALASVMAERGLVEPEAVAGRLAELARVDGGAYLRENLGGALAEVIDLETLERELVDYLAAT